MKKIAELAKKKREDEEIRFTFKPKTNINYSLYKKAISRV